MLKKIKAGMALMKAGRRVQDPAKWKARQIEASAIVAVLWAAVNAAAAFGVEVPVNAEIVDGLAVAILAVVNVVLTVITTNKIGLPDKPKP
jgi:predicted membrane protein